MANEKLLLENSHLRRSQCSSEDSESDSSSSSDSCSSSSSSSPEREPHDTTAQNDNSEAPNGNHVEENGVHNANSPEPGQPVVNGFHSPTD